MKSDKLDGSIVYLGGKRMNELSNCPNCNAIFVKSNFRDVCEKCFKEEEKLFEKVYQYIRKKDNRKAMIHQVIEDTGVEEELIIKFIKTGRLKLAQFPNLGYKCEKCGSTIREGSLCSSCSEQLLKQLKVFNEEEERRIAIEERDKKITYYTKENGRN